MVLAQLHCGSFQILMKYNMWAEKTFKPPFYNNVYIQFIVDPTLAITKTTINACNKI